MRAFFFNRLSWGQSYSRAFLIVSIHSLSFTFICGYFYHSEIHISRSPSPKRTAWEQGERRCSRQIADYNVMVEHRYAWLLVLSSWFTKRGIFMDVLSRISLLYCMYIRVYFQEYAFLIWFNTRLGTFQSVVKINSSVSNIKYRYILYIEKYISASHFRIRIRTRIISTTARQFCADIDHLFVHQLSSNVTRLYIRAIQLW